MPTILIAIDGTDSRHYRRSWTKYFHEYLIAEDKYFHEGPDEIITGSDSTSILEDALRSYYRILSRYNIGPRSSQVPSDFKLICVGHSRGGHILIEFCNRISQPVTFLGLFDAVDMTSALGDTSTVRNARYVYHAMRSPWRLSRNWWGNTGPTQNTSSSSSTQVVRYFMASHAMVGGDLINLETTVQGDNSCTLDVRRFAHRPEDPVLGNLWTMGLLRQGKNVGLCETEALNARDWIKGNAIQRGFRFRSS